MSLKFSAKNFLTGNILLSRNIKQGKTFPFYNVNVQKYPQINNIILVKIYRFFVLRAEKIPSLQRCTFRPSWENSCREAVSV